MFDVDADGVPDAPGPADLPGQARSTVQTPWARYALRNSFAFLTW